MLVSDGNHIKDDGQPYPARMLRSPSAVGISTPSHVAGRWMRSGPRSSQLLAAVHVDVAALQEIIETAHAEPAVAVGLDQEMMPPVLARAAVSIAEQIDQKLRAAFVPSKRDAYLMRLVIEVVHEQHGIVAPVIAQDQHRTVGYVDCLEIPPAHFRNFLAHPNDALGPVEHRVRVAPLRRGIDMLVSERAIVDNGDNGLVALGKAGVRLG